MRQRTCVHYDRCHTSESRTEADPLPPEFLAKAEFFRALSPERRQGLRRLLRETRFERHQVLFFEGGLAESLWLTRHGEVRLYKSSADGTITTLEILGPGQVFGALSALDERDYPMSAEAVTAGAAWRLPKETVLRLLDEEPQLAFEVLHIVSCRLREANERIRAFAHDRAPARLARSLLRASRCGEAHVTRRDLAESSGTTVETAIRVLRRFERDGVIRGEVGLVYVLDGAALQRIAGDPPA
jgi:CRP/FNR family transcriptional regulator